MIYGGTFGAMFFLSRKDKAGKLSNAGLIRAKTHFKLEIPGGSERGRS